MLDLIRQKADASARVRHLGECAICGDTETPCSTCAAAQAGTSDALPMHLMQRHQSTTVIRRSAQAAAGMMPPTDHSRVLALVLRVNHVAFTADALTSGGSTSMMFTPLHVLWKVTLML